jgi:hypothetical protein
MYLHLDSAQARQIAVRQQRDLHRTQRRTRQDGT